MREGYKKTEVGIIPEDWEVKKIGDIVNIKSGSSPSKFNLSEQGEYPFFKVDDMNYGFKYLNNSKLYFDSYDNNLMKLGMIVFSKRGASIFTNKILILNKDGYFDTNLMGLICKKGVNNEFLYYFLYNYELSKIADTSSIPQINNKHIEPLKIQLPPLKEQEKIAEILSTIDSQIEDTEKLIEKSKELKKGLMQKLLTKGIGHSEFKKTEVGEIPVEWEVKSILSVSNTMSGGTPNRSKKHYYIDGNISWVKTGELGAKYIHDTEEKITELAINESSAKLVPSYSVIIAMYGATIGKLSININEVTTNQACCSIICDKDILSYEYLYYYLDFNKDKLIALGAGGAQPNISQQIIRDFKITVPNVNEQEIIIQILSAIDNKVEKEQNKKQKLEELKKGLMQQLLTGKIRTV